MGIINKILSINFLNYLLKGAYRRLYQSSNCPCCHSPNGLVVDRKLFHSLIECSNCRILHRYPSESSSVMSDFYQDGYDEPGITTELPTDHILEKFLQNNFRESPKDFSYHIEILKTLGLKPGNKLLDFGANWGYATYQFKKAGFDTDAFELSKPRAAFGKKLDLNISTRYPEMDERYDMVYSCHVLEHVPNPLETIQKMLAMVKIGGMVVAHTPNGSGSFRIKNPKLFHLLWGRVHPVLLTDQFILKNFIEYPVYVSSNDRPGGIASWDKKINCLGPTDSDGFFFVISKTK